MQTTKNGTFRQPPRKPVPAAAPRNAPAARQAPPPPPIQEQEHDDDGVVAASPSRARADGLNRATLYGNLGADPDLRYLPSGQAVLNLRLATSESYLDANKARQERTEWHSVTVWGKRGEALAKFLRKGASVYVEGRIQTRTSEKDGQKRYFTEIVATHLIVAPRRDGTARGAPEASDADEDAVPFD